MHSGNLKITVIVPVYNSELWLSRCIDSVLDQTHQNLQVILIDDGSTDSSGKICDDYAKRDKRVEVYHTTNRGLVAARKEGILHAQGNYIGFVDADDYIESDMFETLLHDLCESNADFIHTGYIEETEKSRIVTEFEDRVFTFANREEKEDIIAKYVLQPENGRHICNSVWSKLFKKDLISKCYPALPDEQQYGEDFLCLCLCILESRVIRLRKRAFYHYVIREGSLCHQDVMGKIIEETKLNYHFNHILREYEGDTYKRIKKYISYYLAKSCFGIVERCVEGKVHVSRFWYEDANALKGKKVVLYGAGRVGQDFYMQLCRYQEIEIAAWIDSNWQKYHFEYARTAGPAELEKSEYDEVIVAVNAEGVAKEIIGVLTDYGVPVEKIVWKKPKSVLEIGTDDGRSDKNSRK